MALDLEEQEQLAELKAWWKQHGNLIVSDDPGRARSRSPAGRAGAGTRRARRRRPPASTSRWRGRRRPPTPRRCATPPGSLIESYPRTLYASMGALVAARFHFDRNDLKAAKTQLQWVVEQVAVGGFP